MTLSVLEAAENLAAHLGEHELLELAEASGIPVRKLELYAAGELLPCPLNLARLAAALGTTPARLLAEPEPWT